MRLTVVGCSGSLPGPASAASCYLLEADGSGADGEPRTWRVLLDLGSGALGPLQQFVDPMSVDAVLLSHLHADHCLDLCGLYVMLKHSPVGPWPRPRVPVWGPAGTAARLAGAYDLPVDPGMSAELDVQTWTDGESVRIGPFAVTPMRVNHPVEAYGLRIEHDRSVLAYTGDTDSCDSLKPLCHNANMVLADAAFVDGRDEADGIHLSGRRAAQAVLDAEGVQHLVLTHLPPWNDPDVCVAQARELWDGPLDVAAPGRTFDL
ncbi:MBL fold metallo-hydrolase [Angustibacter sp. McL0619]|uniref:MBL fold metallo-hydrolase n=1 Tax=Angustibacter sp. McL0619 TaxID=3415676 RepID=UPI003CEB687A